MRNSDLDQFRNSFREHWHKAIKALGDPNQCEALNGWVGDLKNFADKIHNEGINIMRSHGGTIVWCGETKRVMSRQEFDDWYGQLMTNVLKLKERNDAIAHQNGIVLREPW